MKSQCDVTVCEGEGERGVAIACGTFKEEYTCLCARLRVGCMVWDGGDDLRVWMKVWLWMWMSREWVWVWV
jgi:hypothetical protein